MKRWFLILLPAILLTAGSGNGQSAKDGPLSKLSPNLVALHEQYNSQLAYGTAAVFRSDDPLVIMVDDRVVVDAVASGNADVLKSDLVSLGMQNAVPYGRVVSGELPITAIPAAAALTSLNFARPAAAVTNAGKVTSQGEHAIRADTARTMFGLDGSGVTVGVLSDSFNCMGGAAGDVASGDLSPVNVTSEISSCTGATDEGRAMLQIVHDVAPGASLSFASAFNGQASFAANIQALKAAGAKVIVDDVIYFAEPFFQDGIIAQAVNSVVAGGSAYFSAAGNDDRQSYQSAFRPGDSFADGAIPSGPSAPHFFGGIAHNFNSSGGKDQFQSITIPARATVTFILQWDSPFFSVSGAPGTQNDLDMYILNSSATQILAGTVFNNIGGDAVEIFSFTNNAMTPVTVNIMIVKFSGANPGLIKYIRMGPATVNEYDSQSGTIFGHANVAAAEAVGAVRYSNTPAFGVSPPVLESFSSSGTTPILFDLSGNRLAAPDPRADKPEISGPDGVNTTFFGTDTDGDGFPNFFGTSAAAPHAAAVAALQLQAQPNLTPAQIRTALENTALNMGPAGFDNDSGFGLIQADAAIASVATPPVLGVSPTTVNGGGTVTVSVTNGPGNRTDWVGLFRQGAVDSGYVDWRYLNGTMSAPGTGLTSANFSFPIPTTPGTYEFRLFANDSFTRLATSPLVTVTPPPAPTLPAGNIVQGVLTIQVTASNGPRNRTDWVGLFRPAAADTGFVDWQYLNGTKGAPGTGLTAATLRFPTPTPGGTFEFRFFANDGFTRLATSPPVIVSGPATTLTVSPTTVNGGGTVTVSVTNGPGNRTDWVGLFRQGAADTGYVDWRYLDGTMNAPGIGLPIANFQFTMPTTGGTYEFRLFANNSFTRLVTSLPVTVNAVTPTLAV